MPCAHCGTTDGTFSTDCQYCGKSFTDCVNCLVDEKDKLGEKVWCGGCDAVPSPIKKKKLTHLEKDESEEILNFDLVSTNSGPSEGNQVLQIQPSVSFQNFFSVLPLPKLKLQETIQTKKKRRREVLDLCRSDEQITISLNTLQQRPLDLGVITWNTHGLDQYEEKMKAIAWMFEKHEWLDVLALQEVRKSKKLGLRGEGLTVIRGPLLISVTHWNPKTSKTTKKGKTNSLLRTLTIEDEATDVRCGQFEYYPLVFRKSSVTYKSCRLFFGGEWLDFDARREYFWSKPQKALKKKEKRVEGLPDYRPIVVYTLECQGQTVNVAIVHTTPVGQGLGRKGEYEQVSGFFEAIENKTGHWIIAGDYYIDPESSVKIDSNTTFRPLSHLFRTKAEELKLQIGISISATNQSPLSEKHSRPIRQNEKDLIKDRDIRYMREVTLVIKLRGVEKVRRLVRLDKKYVKNKRADFFLATSGFQFFRVGLVRPKTGLLEVDPNYNALNWWTQLSDHAPVGGIFCTELRSSKWGGIQDQQLLENPERLWKAQEQIFDLHREAVSTLAKAQAWLIERLLNLALLEEEYPLDGSYQPPVEEEISFVKDSKLEVMEISDEGLPTTHGQRAARLCCILDGILNAPYALWLGVKPPKFNRELWWVSASRALDEEVVEWILACEGAKVDLLEDQLPSAAAVLLDVARVIKDVGPALRVLDFDLEDLDLTDEKETYKEVQISNF